MSNEESQPLPSLLKDLAGHPFLKGLDARHLNILAECSMEASFKAGETIFREGDPANRFYLLKNGCVSLETSNGAVVQTIGAGDVLGWSWLFPPYFWSFDARAVEPTEAIFIYGSRLRELCEADHNLGYEIMKRTAVVVIQRLMSTRQQLAARIPTTR
jgi:CRP/FNR family transcriptional regulator, cyclic AMP receptor protein